MERPLLRACNSFGPEHVDQVRAEYPEMKVIVHPECQWEVVQKADLAGSTAYIVKQIEAAPPGTQWAIGTEVHLVNRLRQQHPEQKIIVLSDCQCLCTTMYRIDLPHLCWVLENLVEGKVVNQIKVDAADAQVGDGRTGRMLAIKGTGQPDRQTATGRDDGGLIQFEREPHRADIKWAWMAASVMEFPKLLYIGDVPVESTVSGSVLLYRLLATWPADRLRIVESNLLTPSPSQRLKNVEYRQIPMRLTRLLRTRFRPWWSGRMFQAAQNCTNRAMKIAGVEQFKPDVVLTVGHSYSWVTAANVAEHLGIPLHFIMHDEAILTTGTYPAMAQKINETFVKVYKSAASRLCVCPYMADYFQKLYGVPGDVLYPNRAAGINGFDEPPVRLTETNRPLTFGYAGSLWLPSYVRSLVMLSTIAKKTGDQLLVFSNLSPDGTSSARPDRCACRNASHYSRSQTDRYPAKSRGYFVRTVDL